MKTRKTLGAMVAAVALSAVIAGPVSAHEWDLHGVITCSAYGEQDREMSATTDWTEEAIAAYVRDMSFMSDCEEGSIGFSTVDSDD